MPLPSRRRSSKCAHYLATRAAALAIGVCPSGTQASHRGADAAHDRHAHPGGGFQRHPQTPRRPWPDAIIHVWPSALSNRTISLTPLRGAEADLVLSSSARAHCAHQGRARLPVAGSRPSGWTRYWGHREVKLLRAARQVSPDHARSGDQEPIRDGLPRAWTGGHGYGQIDRREEFRPRRDTVAALYGAYLSGRPQ
jgi:hypothetical protein